MRTRAIYIAILASIGLCYIFNKNSTYDISSSKMEHTTPQSRDLFIGFAMGYGISEIYRLIHAFHKVTTGANQHIVLFVSLQKKTKEILIERFPRAKLLSPDEVLGLKSEYIGIIPSHWENLAFRRYIYQAKYIHDHQNEYDKVILSDIRDVALYGDPFEQINATNFSGVQAFTEIQRYREEKVYNQRWIKQCYGNEFLESIMDEYITCCGTIAGRTEALVNYLHAFLLEFKLKGTCHIHGADTAIHVWIIHNILLDSQIVYSESALIRHCPSDEQLKEKFDKVTGGMYNDNGQLFAIIHQYDRHPTLSEPYNRRHDISQETEEFKVSVGLR